MKKSMHSKVMIIANKLVTQGMSRSEAMVKAWLLVKSPLVESKVAGVTAGRRQEAIEHLTRYDAEDINITLERETDNLYDRNAIAVMASVKDSRSYCVGYLPKGLAALIAPLIDVGKQVKSAFKETRGKYADYMNIGLVVQIAV